MSLRKLNNSFERFQIIGAAFVLGADHVRYCRTEVIRNLFNRARVLTSLTLTLLFSTSNAFAEEEKDWSLAFFTGAMTNNVAAEAINPDKLSFSDNYVSGVILAYDYALGDSKWSLGAELQLNWHYGNQNFGEVAIPVVVRYRPDLQWFSSFNSFSFGLGGSGYTDISELETELAGSSRKTLIYWFLDAEFEIRNPRDSVFVRLHHRSDGYGTLEPAAGSNALVIGFRRAF